MTKAVVTAYTDYKSPYAFVAKEPTYALEQDYDIELEWLPYTLDIADYLDPVETRSDHNWRKIRYAYMDARRLANQQGLTLKGPRRIFDAYYSSVGMLYAQKHGFFRAYHDTVFERFWKRELDVDALEEMSAVIEALGGDAVDYRDYAAGAGREEHDRLREEAVARGVFGVPTFLFDDELFFGGDRLPLLRERLEARGLRRA